MPEVHMPDEFDLDFEHRLTAKQLIAIGRFAEAKHLLDEQARARAKAIVAKERAKAERTIAEYEAARGRKPTSPAA